MPGVTAPTVTTYIQTNAQSYRTNGAPFDPFLIKVSTNVDNVWSNARGDEKVTLWKPQPIDNGFRPLGGLATRDGRHPDDEGILFIKPTTGNEAAVANPVDWIFCFDDAGSRSQQETAAWYAVPPEGYVSFGLYFTQGRGKPPLDAVYCVHSDYARELPWEGYWSDRNSGMKSDGHLGRGRFTADASGRVAQRESGKMLIRPNVCYYGYIAGGVFGPSFTNQPQALVVSPIQAPPTISYDTPHPSPMSGPNVRELGTISDRGVRGVTVVPYLAVVDDLPKRAKNSPFYFIANERFFTLTHPIQNDTPNELEFTESVTTGVGSQTSSAFEQETSVKVSANAGIELGPFSGGASYEMTSTLKLSHAEMTSYLVERTTSFTAKLAPGTSLERWRPTLAIRLYRTDGTAQELRDPLEALSTDSLLELGYPRGTTSTHT